MEVVRRIEADKIMTVLSLPMDMMNRNVEVRVTVLDDNSYTDNVRDTVKKLTGVISNTGMSLSDYREERLKRYEIAD